MAKPLGIIGPEQTGPDYATRKPAFKAIINGTVVDSDWNWGGGYRPYLSLCEIQVDRDDAAGWVLLAMDTTPGNTDSHDFPAKPRNSNIAPSTAPATTAWVNGVTRPA